MISRLPILSIAAVLGCLALTSFQWAPPALNSQTPEMNPPLIHRSLFTPASAPLFDVLIRDAARHNHLDPALLNAIIYVESGFDPRSLSVAGACGLMQLLPATARLFNVQDIYDSKENIEAGAHHFRNLLERYSHNILLSLAAYNARDAPIQRYHGIPPYPETQAYVRQVMLQFRRRSAPTTLPTPSTRKNGQVVDSLSGIGIGPPWGFSVKKI